MLLNTDKCNDLNVQTLSERKVKFVNHKQTPALESECIKEKAQKHSLWVVSLSGVCATGFQMSNICFALKGNLCCEIGLYKNNFICVCRAPKSQYLKEHCVTFQI